MEINLNIRDRLGKSFDLATFEEIKTFFDAEKKYWLEQKSNLGKNLSSPGRVKLEVRHKPPN